MASVLNKVLGSTKSGAGFGSSYAFKVYIDLHCDDESEEPKQADVDADSLKTVDPWECFGRNERILGIFLYKNKLFGWQWTSRFLHHAFVVFETSDYWWSIEKNTQGVTIQRSRRKHVVRDRYRRKARTGYSDKKPFDKLRQDQVVVRNLKDLMNFLQERCLVSTEYNVFWHNCQHFARDIYEHLAPTASPAVSGAKVKVD